MHWQCIYAYQFAVSDTCYQYLSWRALAALQLIDPLVFQLSTVCAERNDFWSNSNVFKLHWSWGRLAKNFGRYKFENLLLASLVQMQIFMLQLTAGWSGFNAFLNEKGGSSATFLQIPFVYSAREQLMGVAPSDPNLKWHCRLFLQRATSFK